MTDAPTLGKLRAMTEIRPFGASDERQRESAAQLLLRAFARTSPAYATSALAREEIARVLEQDRVALAAFDRGVLLGLIGAIRTYDRGWELHPLAVDPRHQRQGIGSLLVRALEVEARREGVLTLYLGTDDEFGGTSLFGADLFPDPLAALGALVPAAGHPLAFYRRLGFAVCGVLPDVNGPGKPDIFMAKRL